jgi:hypothetical protein
LYFIPKLFPKTIIIPSTNLNVEYPPIPTDLTSLNLYDTFSFDFPKPVVSLKPYIVIHMKARFDGCSYDFNTNDIPQIYEFCKTWKSQYTIVLMGDQNPEQNYENKVHKVCSIYKCFEQCKANNDVIDRTKENLCSGANIQEFEEDIHWMNSAVCNIVFGYGGPCSLSNVFTKQTICYVKTLSHWALDLYDHHNHSMVRELDVFFGKLKDL